MIDDMLDNNRIWWLIGAVLILLIVAMCFAMMKADEECRKRGGEIVVTGQRWQVDVIPDGHGGVVTSGHMAPTYGCSK